MIRQSWLPLFVLWTAASCAAAEGDVNPRYRIAYATYLGGRGWDQAREVIAYPDGSILVGAQSASDTMPTTEGVVQPRYAGDDPALGHSGVYGGDCYLARISPDGNKLLSATYFGGSKQERNVYGMALDTQGNIVMTTASRSTDAPTTPNCLQRTYGGGPSDMLVSKLTADLKQLIWCTYVGGSGDDFPRGGLTLDRQDSIYIVGTSTSSDFPVTRGSVQPELRGPRDSAIVKLNRNGSQLEFGTLLGGSGEDDAVMGVRLGAEGNIYFAGHTKSADFPVTAGAAQATLGGQSDCYFAALAPDGDRLLYATYLGGSGNEFAEHRPWRMADGSMLLAGFCASTNFPTTPEAYQRARKGPGDGFLTKLSPDGKRFAFSTLVGGSGGENFLMPTIDPRGNIWIVGSTSSDDFPVTPDALQKTFGGGREDAALAVLSGDGQRLLYASYLGGSGDEMFRSITFGPDGSIYFVGSTSSPDFGTTPNALQPKFAGGSADAFVVRMVAE